MTHPAMPGLARAGGAAPLGLSHPVLRIPANTLRLAAVAGLGGLVLLWRFPMLHGLPCPLRLVTGFPCPSCGMTTSARALTEFDLPAAFAANPMLPLMLVGLLLYFAFGRSRTVRIPVSVVVGVAAVSWVFQLQRVL